MATNPALFEEGEPLNVDKLNDLVNATNSTAGDVSSIKNSTVSIQGQLKSGFPVIQAGQISLTLTKGSNGMWTSPTPGIVSITNMQKSEFQSIVATPVSALSGTEMISTTIGGAFPDYKIYVKASKEWNDSKIEVFYIAVGARATS